MRADAAAQLRLLDLQALDTVLGQLAHRRRGVPQIAELAALDARAGELRDHEVAVRTAVSDLEREMAKAEADVAQVRERIARDQAMLDAGSVASARQLEDLQHEIGNLARRVSDLEDAELEVMEKLEDAQARAASATAALDELAEQRQAAERPGMRPSPTSTPRSRASSGERGPGGAGDPRRPAGALRPDPRRLGRHRRRTAAPRALPGLPAHADTGRPRAGSAPSRPTRSCAARSAGGSSCAPPSPACEAPGHRGRRRLAGQPRSGGLRGGRARRGAPARSSSSSPTTWASRRTTSPSTRA